MFTFEDKGGRSITLRPEGTAPICRAYVEHGMHKLAQPVKLFYVGPFFRHERPQAGRYRQFHQIGAEAIGTDSPLADAEVIMLLDDLLATLGVPGVELRLGSLGSLEARSAYLERAEGATCARNEGELREDVRERIDVNPLRAFDADDEGTRGGDGRARRRSSSASRARTPTHFAEVRALLDAAGVEYAIDPTLVRGLDYYTRTIFSFVCDRLGAQSEIGGGGRYDGLIEQLGGPPTPAVGWAAGIERILLALERGSTRRPPARRLRRRRRARPDAAGDGAARRRAARRRPLGRGRPRRAQRSRASSSTPTGSARGTVADPRGGRRRAAARHARAASRSQLIEIAELLGRSIGAEQR